MNFCAPIFQHAQQAPDQAALIIPRMQGSQLLAEETCSYGDLMTRIGRYQDGLEQAGYAAGDRIIILLRPCIDLYALTLALLATGMVPVFIDSGMPRTVIRAAIRAAGARALVSHKLLMRWAFLLPEARGMQRFALEGGGLSYQPLSRWSRRSTPPVMHDCLADDKGLITFTSGSTGTPKGANRTHGSLINQHQAIRAHWPDQPGDIDMPCFPVLVLHNLCCGMTTVMPRVDLASPGEVHGDLVIEQVRRHGVSRLSGAPAFMARVASAARQRPECLDSLRDVVVGGATVSPRLQALLAEAFPQQNVRIVYGSTEAEPIADVTLNRLRQEDDERGYLVGDIAHGCDLAIVDDSRPLDSEQSVERARLAPGQCGEILVRGDHVLKGYVDNPAADRENKIPCANGLVWHRTGDTGFVDAHGALHLTGRIKDRIRIGSHDYEILPLEKAIERIPGVARAALLRMEEQPGLHLCVETLRDEDSGLTERVDQWRKQFPGQPLRLYRLKHMPVDRRHNSKLDRVTLRSMINEGKLKPWRALQASGEASHD